MGARLLYASGEEGRRGRAMAHGCSEPEVEGDNREGEGRARGGRQDASTMLCMASTFWRGADSPPLSVA
jgi:hypothetical protein